MLVVHAVAVPPELTALRRSAASVASELPSNVTALCVADARLPWGELGRGRRTPSEPSKA